MDTTKVVAYKSKFKLALVCGFIDPTIDKLEDEKITVSGLYTIVGGGLPVVMLYRSAMAEEIKKNPIRQVWYEPIILPNGISPEKIVKLSDVTRLGGKILRSQYFE